MEFDTIIAVLAIGLALGFDFVNGFHDTANTVATVIYTKALKPRVAMLMSGILNFLGALFVGTAVAQVITKIIPEANATLPLVVAVLLAAVTWNLITWYYGLPISSSHCLIGALFGAGITSAGGLEGVEWGELSTVLWGLIVSPIAGFAAGCGSTWLALKVTGEGKKEEAGEKPPSEKPPSQKPASPGLMRWLHIVSSASVSFSHGGNDGQKTMGVITLILATHFASSGYKVNVVPLWVIVAAASAIGLGTIVGGWKIIRTVGTKISKERISHAQGFAASMSTAIIILIASSRGAPISTTHTLSSAVAGGTIPVYGRSKLNFKTMKLILLAWIMTFPVAAILASISYMILRAVWHR